MSAIDVLFTRTYDGDYIADFSCNESELPETSTFEYKVISDAELSALRSAASERDAAIEAAVNDERKRVGHIYIATQIDGDEVFVVKCDDKSCPSAANVLHGHTFRCSHHAAAIRARGENDKS